MKYTLSVFIVCSFALALAPRVTAADTGHTASGSKGLVVSGRAAATDAGIKTLERGVMVESSKKVKPWREAVRWSAIEAQVRVAGPVEVVMVFTVPKPRSAPKRRRTWPDRRPDLDKLQRSTLDALVSVGAIEDDARVVTIRAVKAFPNEYPGALKVPGVRIRVDVVDRGKVSW